MEEYSGIVILATNLKANMDEAFVRRLRFIIDFPFPGEKNREKIWQKVFPDEAPLSTEVDFPFLARRLEIAGGNIKNISLRAAYLAADKDEGIHMEHLIAAAKRELRKIRKNVHRSRLPGVTGKFQNKSP